MSDPVCCHFLLYHFASAVLGGRKERKRKEKCGALLCIVHLKLRRDPKAEYVVMPSFMSFVSLFSLLHF